jgi:hypothetical protein
MRLSFVSKAVGGMRTRTFLFFAGTLWTGLLVLGFSILAREEFTPVARTLQPPGFPAQSALQLASDKPTLLLFAHPLCPCTRASLHELDDLLAEVPDKVSVMIVFTIPDGLPSGWEKGDLYQAAKAIPGARVVLDQAGREARRFGVTGSGHTLLYSSSGRLLFSGGITASRGHEGDNPGEAAIVSLVLHGHSLVTRTPVFGCSLL